MLNRTNPASAIALPQQFEVVPLRFDRQRELQAPHRHRLPDGGDPGDAAAVLAILAGGIADPYRRALQALRDVRHLLPPEGVAIVDSVLDCA